MSPCGDRCGRRRGACPFLVLGGLRPDAMCAASHPDLVRALVLISPQPRLVAGPGYEWAPSVEERASFVQDVVQSWGEPTNRFAVLVGGQDERLRRVIARIERLAMGPAAAAASLVVDWQDRCTRRASQRAVSDAGAAP